ncbi:hypothetical protein [Aeromonas phage SW69-9]|uniref:Uncharacterized protein n=1 Tax=Aeromonas phage vB_AehM_DM2 TaxID=2973716 RepID=A0AA95C7L0_9CAUD|nr:hypothetical protein [Aeromonas phage Riv-10]APU02527.1 hypothetical protein [Aeromonas phage SW69-9]UYD59537.1 hypothetical protein JNMOADIG_00008 [Aeromonas phage avDM5]UYD60489.1 hypothetical protein NPHMPGLK_00154 [Aeromonas phage avDM2]UYD60675.1 hypothetical protein NHNEHLNL_00079 [Aeromonas phage avDM2]
MNPVAKNDFNKGGPHVDRKKRDSEGKRKQKHKKKDYDNV